MRIACAYHPRLTSGCGKFHFVAEALQRLWHDVVHVQTSQELAEADRSCDLILFEQRHPASIGRPELLEISRKRGNEGAIWVQLYFDLNVFDPDLSIDKQCTLEASLDIARAMDLVCVKERDRLAEYCAAGISAVWLDQGCPQNMSQARLQENPPFDVVLWGSTSRPLWSQRWDDAELLARFGFRVGWATRDGSVPQGVVRIPDCQPLELQSVIEQGKIALCVDACQTIDGYWSDRIWLAAGAGACTVRRRSEGDRGLPGHHYRTEAELIETVKWLCGDFSDRRQSGEESRRWTMKWHTYESRMEEVFQHVGLIQYRRAAQAQGSVQANV